ncbi:MAG: Gfo/Idh/MocA family oxidoreductase [Actinobacteria bacterium]|nr:Gfo/Idh/MocA family oxidoreductase [Actinomycetota bacterium]
MANTHALGVGLVGCGMIGQIHADGLAKLAAEGRMRPVAAADPSPEARDGVNRNCGFERLGPDPAAVIDDADVDVVFVTAPTAAHRELVLHSVAAGKPLLCEKPLAPTFDVVGELCDAVAASGVAAQVGFHSRFHPILRTVRDLLNSGELGSPMGYTLRDDQYWPTGGVVDGHSSWRSERAQAGGGALIEHSIHAADIVSWLFGPAVDVYAAMRNVFGYDVEDAAALTITHASGVVGNLVTIFNGVRGREERRIEIFFERGAVEVTTNFVVGAGEDSMRVQIADEPARQVDLTSTRDACFDGFGIDRRDFLFYQYVSDRMFLDAVRAGSTATPGFEDARVAHALVDAAYRSSTTGMPASVALEPADVA